MASKTTIGIQRSLAGFVCIAAWAITMGVGHAADSFMVSAAPRGPAIQVHAQVHLRAPLSVIWHTLTDYEHLPFFIPGMKTSRVVSRRGATAIVEQTGSATMLFFGYPIEVTVESVEHHPRAIEIHLVKGNIGRLDGFYELEASVSEAQAYTLRWSGLIQPGVELPNFITIPVVRASIQEQFTGMVREIERRESERRRLLAATK